jgi:formyltetrahydrofolate-dependent phosphoribosylglycinamide formyltransferase
VIETGELHEPPGWTLPRVAELRLDRGPVGAAVLLSGSGRTLENLIQAIACGELNVTVRVVVGSKPGVRGLQIARENGIPSLVIRRRDHLSDLAYSEAVYAAVHPYEAELLLLAGFLRKLTVPPEWEGRILNIHPALLPEAAAAAGKGFYGDRVHAAVLASGAAESGATVHVVDNGYDTGPVVLREAVPVLPDDTATTLAARVFAAECRLYPKAIQKHIVARPDLFGG